MKKFTGSYTEVKCLLLFNTDIQYTVVSLESSAVTNPRACLKWESLGRRSKDISFLLSIFVTP